MECGRHWAARLLTPTNHKPERSSPGVVAHFLSTEIHPIPENIQKVQITRLMGTAMLSLSREESDRSELT